MRINSQVRPLSEEELATGFVVPTGAVVIFELPRVGKKSITMSAQNIQHLRLVEKLESPDEPTKRTIDVFPKEVANAITQNLFANMGNSLETVAPLEDNA